MSQRPDVPSCGDVLERLEPFIDGELSSARAAAIERHLATCSACRTEAAMARQVREELRGLPMLDAPPAILAAVAEGTSGRRPRTVWSTRAPLRAIGGWALAAALLLAAVLAPLWLRRGGEETIARGGETVEAIDPTERSEIGPSELERATEEARVALAYVGQVSRRTGLKIRDGLIVEQLVVPTAEGLSSLGSAPRRGSRGDSNET